MFEVILFCMVTLALLALFVTASCFVSSRIRRRAIVQARAANQPSESLCHDYDGETDRVLMYSARPIFKNSSSLLVHGSLKCLHKLVINGHFIYCHYIIHAS